MSPSRTFILRPVATTLLMVGILLAGAVAYKELPVSALPEVDYPTIQVTTTYPGANPDVMASSVTAPLERQFGQVPGLQQMTSISSEGLSVITLEFNLSLNIDVAEQEVQQSINASGTYLPADLPTPPLYSKTNPADTPILTLALSSSTLPLSKVEDLADTRLSPKISQLPGVGLVSISGGQKPAVRIQANPSQLAAYGINLEDLRSAIIAANVNQAKGNFDGPRQSYQIGANDQLLSSSDYANLVVAYKNGAPVQMTQVADVVDSVEDIHEAAWMNNTPAVIVNIQRQPGANIISVVDRIKQLLPQLTSTLPEAIKVQILTDRTTTIRASVSDVEFELMLTIGSGGDGHLSILTKSFGHHYPERRGAAIAGGNLRRDVSAGLQPEQSDADGPDHFHRLRGGRRHRDDREHRPLHRGGRASAARRAQGRRTNRLHDYLAHRFAGGRSHPAAVHGRHRRPPVPRVRSHAFHHHPDVGGGLPHADADDVFETAEAHARSAAGALLPRIGKGLDVGDRAVREDLEVGVGAANRDAAGGRRHAGGNHHCSSSKSPRDFFPFKIPA